MWPTATSADGERASPTMMRGNPTLPGAASRWQTPTSTDAAGRDYTYSGGDHEKPFQTLVGQAQAMWPTPDANAMNDGDDPEVTRARREREKEKHQNGNGFGLTLGAAVSMWSTPSAHDGRRPGSDATSTQGRNLKRESEAWAIPNARDADKWHYREPGHDRQVNLSGQAAYESGRQRPETSTAGDPSSPSAPTSRRRLNPAFVEWLMGWPEGWLSLEPINSASSGTASSQTRPRSRSASSRESSG